MDDYDTFDDGDTDRGLDTLSGSFVEMISFANIKIGIFLFVLFLIVNSSQFIMLILSHIGGAISGTEPTGKGVIVLGTVYVLGYLIFDMLVRAKVL